MAAEGDKVACRTPAEGRDGVTNIPAWKFEMMRDAIRTALAGKTLPFADLAQAVKDQLSDEDRARLGSIGWHVTTVKLELEVRGEIERLSVKGPQQIRLTT
jgi:hypothetical protein